DARRLIPIAIHECEKSGHHRPLPPPQDRRRIRAQHEHIKNVTTHPALTGEGGNRYIAPVLGRGEDFRLQSIKAPVVVTGDDRADLPRSAFYADLDERLTPALGIHKHGVKKTKLVRLTVSLKTRRPLVSSRNSILYPDRCANAMTAFNTVDGVRLVKND